MRPRARFSQWHIKLKPPPPIRYGLNNYYKWNQTEIYEIRGKKKIIKETFFSTGHVRPAKFPHERRHRRARFVRRRRAGCQSKGGQDSERQASGPRPQPVRGRSEDGSFRRTRELLHRNDAVAAVCVDRRTLRRRHWHWRSDFSGVTDWYHFTGGEEGKKKNLQGGWRGYRGARGQTRS